MIWDINICPKSNQNLYPLKISSLCTMESHFIKQSHRFDIIPSEKYIESNMHTIYASSLTEKTQFGDLTEKMFGFIQNRWAGMMPVNKTSSQVFNLGGKNCV